MYHNESSRRSVRLRSHRPIESVGDHHAHGLAVTPEPCAVSAAESARAIDCRVRACPEADEVIPMRLRRPQSTTAPDGVQEHDRGRKE